MADWRDVMDARQEADAATAELLSWIGQRPRPDHPSALLLAARAVCLELRAHATLTDFALRDAVTRRG